MGIFKDIATETRMNGPTLVDWFHLLLRR